MVAAIAAIRPAQSLTSDGREGTELGRRDLGPDPFQGDGGAFRVRLGLRLQRPQLGNTFLQRVVAQIGNTLSMA
jgi:hypothetical protein